MTCTVLEQSAREDGLRSTAGIEPQSAAHLSGEVDSTTQAQSSSLKVGAFTPDENAVAVPGVIHYEYKPLIDLVSNPALKSALYLAVTKSQASIGAPFYMVCVSKTSKRYWSLNEEGCIELRKDKAAATLFYLRFTPPAVPSYFCITVQAAGNTSDLTTGNENEEQYISISRKSCCCRFFCNDWVQLKAKMHEADQDNILFQFRDRVAPQNIPDPGMVLPRAQPIGKYVRIKPKCTEKFLTADDDGFSCRLQLLSLAECDKQAENGFPLLCTESSVLC